MHKGGSSGGRCEGGDKEQADASLRVEYGESDDRLMEGRGEWSDEISSLGARGLKQGLWTGEGKTLCWC